MFVEGLFNMYVHDPALFWRFMLGITPGFVIAVPYGLLEQSRELNNRKSPRWGTLKFILVTDLLSQLWIAYVFDWPYSDMTVTLSLVVLVLYGFVLMFPILGGIITGLWLMKMYWFTVQTIRRFQ